MSEAAPAPPTKPRGPRRWPWVVVVVALLLVAYVGTYVHLRVTDELGLNDYFAFRDPGEPRAFVFDYDAPSGSTLRLRLLAPLVTVEEWWNNR